jgi:hypothetical protein
MIHEARTAAGTPNARMPTTRGTDGRNPRGTPGRARAPATRRVMQPVGLPAGLGRRTAARAAHHFLEGDLTKAGCGPVVRHADEGGSLRRKDGGCWASKIRLKKGRSVCRRPRGTVCWRPRGTGVPRPAKPEAEVNYTFRAVALPINMEKCFDLEDAAGSVGFPSDPSLPAPIRLPRPERPKRRCGTTSPWLAWVAPAPTGLGSPARGSWTLAQDGSLREGKWIFEAAVGMGRLSCPASPRT